MNELKGKMNMTKIDIISGFLGAGKTTLIKKLLEEAYKGEKVVLIENEFGEMTQIGDPLELERDYGIRIVSYEYDEPIENTFGLFK